MLMITLSRVEAEVEEINKYMILRLHYSLFIVFSALAIKIGLRSTTRLKARFFSVTQTFWVIANWDMVILMWYLSNLQEKTPLKILTNLKERIKQD